MEQQYSLRHSYGAAAQPQVQLQSSSTASTASDIAIEQEYSLSYSYRAAVQSQ
jgi:hypothetical protein